MASPDLIPLQYEGRRTLADFFPPDNPLTSWMFRIAVIRDDLAFEVQGLGLKEDADEGEVWRCNYFVRKVCVTLQEAAGVFAQELQTYGNRRRTQSPRLTEMISRAREVVVAARSIVDPMRNALRAHVRPPHFFARFRPSPDAQQLTTTPLNRLADQLATIIVDFGDKRRTSYRGATSVASFLAWPDVGSLKELTNNQERLRNAILESASASIGAIDVVLAGFWVDLGIIPIPEDFGIDVGLPRGWPPKVPLESACQSSPRIDGASC
jgi:hypothetical protein